MTTEDRKRDDHFMVRALALARKGGRAVRPNPLVGAVVVENGREIASGYHARFGGPHAEVVAIEKAGKAARGATLYVTLEPCSTFGKTPPCSDLIISRGLKRVVIGVRDENLKHRGRASRILRAAGIAVRAGVRERECAELNRDFFVWVAQRRPYALLKLALTLDGKIADPAGRSRWISSAESRRLVHRLRARSDAVLVGVNTVIRDDPRLTARMGRRHPGLLRVVLDSRGRIPLAAHILTGPGASRTIVSPRTLSSRPGSSPAARDRTVRILTARMLASASPRKPRVPTRTMSSTRDILLVEKLSRASGSSACGIPAPLSSIL
ncbi:MAG: bifunctional diaminohydroxyphosphoribosylaminopyrimidine deaminase/5-amino-6-(5-phosphoribosylamino)uracil reductase RibD, partial [Candidatus Aureabacteria bacterium]|nr:bifunctional diaminohydroxyphosphoribosylaminopyrimidine deaminase/5-amino-6-(5-phosphoribosylamino)uracil reductase RibD [Candidatus Auribacterota bacterium]